MEKIQRPGQRLGEIWENDCEWKEQKKNSIVVLTVPTSFFPNTK